MERSNPGAAACLAIFAQTLSETERQKLRENCELLFRLLGGEPPNPTITTTTKRPAPCALPTTILGYWSGKIEVLVGGLIGSLASTRRSRCSSWPLDLRRCRYLPVFITETHIERNRVMTQATIEWLPTANGNWIGCNEEGKVVYKNDMLKANWEGDNSEEVRKAKTLIGDWIAARRTRAAIAEGDPKAFGDQAEKDKKLDSATAQVEHFKAKASAAINEAYGIS